MIRKTEVGGLVSDLKLGVTNLVGRRGLDQRTTVPQRKPDDKSESEETKSDVTSHTSLSA